MQRSRQSASKSRTLPRAIVSCSSARRPARSELRLQQKHALAAGLAIEQLIGRLGLCQLPAIREQVLDVDLVVGDEARAVGLDGGGESPRADDGELLAQHLRTDVD